MTPTETAPTPPAAEKRPVTLEQHGVSRTDEYAWLRDERWQEVLRDPSVLSADIRDYLEAEVAYYEASTEALEPLRERLFEEMRGRIKEDESSVPMPDGPYAYAVRYRTGGQYPIYVREPVAGGEEEVLLDGDAEGEGLDSSAPGDAEPSPDHRLIAVGTQGLTVTGRLVDGAALVVVVLLADRLVDTKDRTTRATVLAPAIAGLVVAVVTIGGGLFGAGTILALWRGTAAGAVVIVAATLIETRRSPWAAVPLLAAAMWSPTCTSVVIAPPFGLGGCL